MNFDSLGSPGWYPRIRPDFAPGASRARSRWSAWLFFFGLLGDPLVRAATLTNSAATPVTQLDWNPGPKILLQKFNPNLGTLRSAELSLTFRGEGDYYLQNFDGIPRQVDLTIQIDVKLRNSLSERLLAGIATNQVTSRGLVTSNFAQSNLVFKTTPAPLVLTSASADLRQFIGSGGVELTFTALATARGKSPDNSNFAFFADAVATARIVYTYDPPCPRNCVETAAYWKAHPECWPTNRVTLGRNSYSSADLIGILCKPVCGDVTIALAHQLIAARLNTHPDVGNPAVCISATLVSADEFLRLHPVCSDYRRTTSLVAVLENYNWGRLCAPACAKTPSRR